MTTTGPEWERRVAELWAAADELGEADFHARMNRLAAERPEDDAAALYELGSAQDSTGHSDRAVPLYRQALANGLGSDRRRQAVIQLASSLRNLGEVQESVALLAVEREQASDELDDAVAGFLALALADSGREREALALALGALAGHMTRYRRSLIHYAAEMAEPTARR